MPRCQNVKHFGNVHDAIPPVTLCLQRGSDSGCCSDLSSPNAFVGTAFYTEVDVAYSHLGVEERSVEMDHDNNRVHNNRKLHPQGTVGQQASIPACIAVTLNTMAFLLVPTPPPAKYGVAEERLPGIAWEKVCKQKRGTSKYIYIDNPRSGSRM